ncbi:OmpP1/FadL family transporter [Pseudomonas vancouverensis]|uniref:Hydrocarbon degradation protein n=1 Tax=Pseudomonas vancouverensis TaxID=95300 RepID=A0A1H2NMX6_PSEVA|nr:outer membrane protein transport protein [Pseudomonas vancouverensis]KAB0495309.1 hydrocarbon degradation protein [Pseudomonas vancouverensis]TDB56930.1 hydrocarbon degradation protein [Pseudomonas vancouverensis]SDV06688.1 long-chain fatty acid transport protein [Pseudomonas vancouverensis]
MNTNLAMRYSLAGLGLMLCGSQHCQAMNFNIPTSASIESAQMGGASMAFAQSSMIASDNPAGMANLGNRLDGGLQMFFGSFRSSFGNEENRDDFKVQVPIPSGGFSHVLDERTTLGMSVYSIGSGSDYSHAAVRGQGFPDVKTRMTYLIFAPTLAYKVTADFAVGVSTLIGVQQLQARGLVAPQPDGSLGLSPTHGIQTQTGYGWRVGALWTINPLLSVGASYSPKMRFADADGYENDLLAVAGGHLDLPAQYGAGIALHLTPTLTLAADYLRLEWSDVGFLNDPKGAGLNSQNVYRVGFSWDAANSITLRAGFKRASEAVDSDHTAANYYSPGILNDSVSAGFTYHLPEQTDVSLGYEYHLPDTLRGTGPSTGSNIGAHYSQVLLGVGMKF